MEKKELINNIHISMLDKLSSEFDKSTGSWAYDILFPPSNVFADMKEEMEEVDSDRSIFSKSGDDLDEFISQFSPIKRNRATYASGSVTITGKPGTVIDEGIMVASASHQYEVVNRTKIDDNGVAIVEVRSYETGSTYNTGVGNITRFPITIRGLESVTNNEPISGGYEEESDESVRQRYFDYINLPITSGNIYHYKKWATDVAGVGAVRVIPLWDGDRTVKLVLIDSNGQSASEELVNETQEYIDPKGEQREDGTWTKWGGGYGQAPVGAFCTVTPANKLPVSVSANVTLEYGVSIEDIEEKLTKLLVDRFGIIALREDDRIISVARTGATLLNIDGVKDYDSRTLMINGSQENINLGEDDVAEFEEVILNEN